MMDIINTEVAIGSIPITSSKVELSTSRKKKTTETHLQNTSSQSQSAVLVSDVSRIKNPNAPIDFQNIDFMGPAEAVKQILAMPYATRDAHIALHKMGSTVLIDTVPNVDGIKLEDNLLPSPIDALPGAKMLQDMSHLSDTMLMPSTASDSPPLHSGSEHLPPAGFYLPNFPQPYRQTLQWQLQEMRLALGSDMILYSTDEHPLLTAKPLDTSKPIEMSLCLDYYLDNVMANVPELALFMHSKGFLRGVSILKTEDIPNLNQKHRSAATVGPLFDPTTIEFNATAILRFIQENCTSEGSTYILKRCNDSNAIQLYDLSAIAVNKQIKWKWLLAMMSYRFAVRLDHHYNNATATAKIQIRQRQLSLYSSSYSLLREIAELGGDTHGTICASILEHIADIRLHHVDSYLLHKRSSNNGDCAEYDNFNMSEELEMAQDKLLEAFKTLQVLLEAEKIHATPTDANIESTQLVEVNASLGVCLSILVQQTGVLHKLLTATVSQVRDVLVTTRTLTAIPACVNRMRCLIDPLSKWRDAMESIKFSVASYSPTGECTSRDELVNDIRNIDTTILSNLPLIWNALSDICRELQQEEELFHDERSIIQELFGVMIKVSRVAAYVTNTSIEPHWDTWIGEASIASGRSFSKKIAKTCGIDLVSALECVGKVLKAIEPSLFASTNSKMMLFMMQSFGCCYDVMYGVMKCANWPFWEGEIPPMHWMRYIDKLDSGVAKSLRRVASVCNEIGQYMYKRACALHPSGDETKRGDTEGCVISEFQDVCDSAELYYDHAISLFEAVHDSVNLSAVLCNASSLKRLRAMHGPHLCELLQQAIALCQRAHAALEERTNAMWDRVNQEAANCYLTLGLHYAESAATSTKIAELASEHLSQALKIYKELSHERQVAATHFHLGSMFTALHQSASTEASNDASKGKKNNSNHYLAAALSHYRDAYEYYMRCDVGPTLMTILLQLSDLYMASYIDSEVHLYSCLQLLSAREPTDCFGLPQSIIDMELNRLSGALQALLVARCSLTPAVLERHGEAMLPLVKKFAVAVSDVLRRVLKLVGCTKKFWTSAEADIAAELKLAYKYLLDHCSVLLTQNAITFEEAKPSIMKFNDTLIALNANASLKNIFNIHNTSSL